MFADTLPHIGTLRRSRHAPLSVKAPNMGTCNPTLRMKTVAFVSFAIVFAFWNWPAVGQITVRQLTNNTNDNTWGVRNSATSGGQILWVDGDDSVMFFNGTATNVVQRRDALGYVDNVVFTLGSGATPGHVIGVWRRDTDSGWVSVDGAPPVPVNATNPINPANGLNAEGVAVADGYVFMILQAGTFKHVFKVDPVTGQGTDLTGNAQVPGAQGRISTSHGQAVWPFQDNTNNIARLHFYDGSSLQVLETNLQTNPQIANGRIVYLKQVGNLNQVFLYDSTSASPAPVQVTTDATGTNAFPRTDGRHIAWLHTFAGATNPAIILNGGVQLTTPETASPNQIGDFREHPFQLDRGQILWEDTAARLEYCPGTGPFALDISPSISFGSISGEDCCIPWLQDGFVAWTGPSTGSTNRQVFLLSAIPPADAQQPMPPLLLQATPTAGQVTLTWDSVIGATSYNLYLAFDPMLNQTNYGSVAGGRKIAGVTSPHVVQGLTNRIYFFAISSMEGAVEGPSSPPAMVAFWAAANAPQTNYHAIAAGLTNGGTAYAAGGLAVYQTTDGGAHWSALSGGSQGLDVRALAVDGPRVYAASLDIFNVGPAKVLRSLDSGLDWSAVVPDGGQLGEQNKVLALDPTNPSRMYGSDFRLPTIHLPGDSYVIRSVDGGSNWFHLPNPTKPLGAEIDAYAIAINPRNPSIVYAGGTGTPNLVRSSDYGTNWTDVNVGAGYVYSLAIDPLQSNTLYAGVVNFTAVSRGLLKSTNSGASWSASNTGFPSPLPKVYSLLIDPLNAQQIHAGTDQGYYFSLDGGGRWISGNSGLPNPSAQYLSALSLTASRQLLAASSSGIYRLDLSTLNLTVPSLAIAPLAIAPSGSVATLYWPASADAFSLQSAAGLDSATSWVNVSNLVAVTNGLKTVTIGLSNRAAFYRLALP